MAGVEYEKVLDKAVLRKEAQTLRGKGYRLCRAFYDEKTPSALPRTPLVCKIMEKDSLPRVYSRKLLPMQMEVLGRLDHPNIVRLHSILASQLRYFIFMEDCENGNLFDFISRHGPVTPDLAKYWFRQILQALAYCHSNSIAHRNLTVQNVLISATQHVKLTGFDFGTIFSRNVLNITTCGSAYYLPPEILAGVPYDPTKGDVWCAGVVLVYILTRTYAFPASKPIKLLKLQQNGIETSGAWGILLKIISSDYPLQEFIKTFFQLNPVKRPSVDELLENEWIQETQKSGHAGIGQWPGKSSTNQEAELLEFQRKETQLSIALESGLEEHTQNLDKRRPKIPSLENDLPDGEA